jgi:hypothetical protein
MLRTQHSSSPDKLRLGLYVILPKTALLNSSAVDGTFRMPMHFSHFETRCVPSEAGYQIH